MCLSASTVGNTVVPPLVDDLTKRDGPSSVVKKFSSSGTSNFGTDTLDLIKTGQRVVGIQDNLQHVWDAAGEAMIDYGLSDADTLPIFTLSRKEEETNLFDLFKSDENFLDLIEYRNSASNTNT